MSGIFSINNPERLFSKLVKEFGEFCECPSEEGVFDVVFPLYHLREWICPEGNKSYEKKPKATWSREETLHYSLYHMPEYQMIQSLCNSAKHFNASDLEGRTEELEGFRCGLGRVGDPLDITHYIVDDKDIRDYFYPVYSVYFAYFKRATPE